MPFIVDINVLISPILKDSKCRDILVTLQEHFLLLEIVLDELRDHSQEVLKKSNLSENELHELLELLLKRMVVISVEKIKPYRTEAIEIMKDSDPDDAFLIATALAYRNAIIWSDDADLKRQKVIAVYTTKEMSALLV